MSLTVRELITRWAFKSDVAKVGKFNKAIEVGKKVAGLAAKAVVGFGVATMGAATALAAMVKAQAASDDALGKLSDRLGVGVEDLSGLKHAAELSGASVEDLGMALKGVSVKAADAAKDAKSGPAKMFRELGIAVKDSTGALKDPVALLYEVSEAIKETGSDAQRTNIAIKMFEEAGLKLMPMLSGGAQGIGEMQAEARKLGIVLDETGKKNAANFNDALLRAESSVKGIAFQIVRGLTPALTGYLTKAKDWMMANREMIRQKLDEYVQRFVRWFRSIDWAAIKSGAMGVVSVLLTLASALAWVFKDGTRVKVILGFIAGMTVISGLLSVVGAVKGIWLALGGIAALKGLGSFFGVVGAIGAAAAAGYAFGKVLDRVFGISDKLVDNMLQGQRELAKLRVAAFAKQADIVNAAKMARDLAGLASKGVQTIRGPGGKEQALTRATAEERVSGFLQKQGKSAEEISAILASLGDQFRSIERASRTIPGATGGAAPAPGRIASSQTTITAPITVNVPPGTPQEQVRRLGDAAKQGAVQVWRHAQPDIAR